MDQNEQGSKSTADDHDLERARETMRAMRDDPLPEDPGQIRSWWERMRAEVDDAALVGSAREQLLLAIHHTHRRLVGLGRRADDQLARIRDEMDAYLEQMSDGAAQETDEYVRGRRRWVAIVRRADEPDNEQWIASYLAGMGAQREESAFVWERVFAALTNHPRPELIFPVVASLPLPEDRPSTYHHLARQAQAATTRAMEAVTSLRARLPVLLADVATGTIKASEAGKLVADARGALRRFLLPPDQTGAYAASLPAPERARVLNAVTYGVNQEDTDFVAEIALHSRPEQSAPAGTGDDAVERVASLSLLLVAHRLRSHSEPDALVSHAVELLRTDLPAELRTSAHYYTLYQVAGHAINLLGDPTALIEKETELLTRLLGHHSAFVRLIPANIALRAAKAGASIEPLRSALEAALAESPETRNGFATGSDIKPDEFALPESSVVMELPVESPEGGFFSVGGLTGLLEACQHPNIAWRIAEALELVTPDDPPAAPPPGLMMMATTPIRPAEEQDADEAAADEARKRCSEKQPGPLVLDEVIAAFDELGSVGNGGAVDEWAEDLATQLDRRQAAVTTGGQRDLIKRVFDGAAVDLANADAPFFGIVRQIRSLGFEPIAHSRGAVPGDSEDERSFDTLAYYRSEAMLGPERRHQFGIYYRVHAIRRFLSSTGVQPVELLLPLTVHELFHHFVELELAERYLAMVTKSDPFRPLEEAAANYYAHRYVTDPSASHELGDSARQALLDRMLRPLSAGGLRGYGEYGYLDERAATTVPRMLASLSVEPRHYAAQCTFVLAGAGLAQTGAAGRWESLVSALREPTVPLYLDFLP